MCVSGSFFVYFGVWLSVILWWFRDLEYNVGFWMRNVKFSDFVCVGDGYNGSVEVRVWSKMLWIVVNWTSNIELWDYVCVVYGESILSQLLVCCLLYGFLIVFFRKLLFFCCVRLIVILWFRVLKWYFTIEKCELLRILIVSLWLRWS